MNIHLTMPQLSRMRDLRGVGLSYSAIAAVMRLDYGLTMTAESARYWLRRYGDTQPRRCSPHGMTKLVGAALASARAKEMAA